MVPTLYFGGNCLSGGEQIAVLVQAFSGQMGFRDACVSGGIEYLDMVL